MESFEFKKSDPLVSILIRTKNEEHWIGYCLTAIFSQSYKSYEIILIDNESTDKTVEKAAALGVSKIVTIDKYRPGAAINRGAEVATGDFLVILSAHCIPLDENWLSGLVNAIRSDANYAGVYGRQVPMSFSSLEDKRDLLLLFGRDPKIQRRDGFFHNANSILRRDLWEKFPFDEEITNIEDRIWGEEIIRQGWQLYYCPDSAVFHHHGVHQSGEPERLRNVVRIIEKTTEVGCIPDFKADGASVCVIIPVRGRTRLLGDIPQIAYTINTAKSCRWISEVFVITDDPYTAQVAKDNGALIPFERPSFLSDPDVNMETVLAFSVEQIEKVKIYDVIVLMEETFPLRSLETSEKVISKVIFEGYDSSIACRADSSWLWEQAGLEDGDISSAKRVDQGDAPRRYKSKIFIGMHGLCLACRPENARRLSPVGPKCGLVIIEDLKECIEIRTNDDAKFYERLIV